MLSYGNQDLPCRSVILIVDQLVKIKDCECLKALLLHVSHYSRCRHWSRELNFHRNYLYCNDLNSLLVLFDEVWYSGPEWAMKEPVKGGHG